MDAAAAGAVSPGEVRGAAQATAAGRKGTAAETGRRGCAGAGVWCWATIWTKAPAMDKQLEAGYMALNICRIWTGESPWAIWLSSRADWPTHSWQVRPTSRQGAN